MSNSHPLKSSYFSYLQDRSFLLDVFRNFSYQVNDVVKLDSHPDDFWKVEDVLVHKDTHSQALLIKPYYNYDQIPSQIVSLKIYKDNIRRATLRDVSSMSLTSPDGCHRLKTEEIAKDIKTMENCN